MTKIQLRNAWFQVHKWIGLLLAVLIIPVSLTGAVLVWHDPLEQALYPERSAITGPQVLPFEAYATAAQRSLGRDEALQRIQLPKGAAEAVIVSATKPGRGRPQRVTLYLDPPTAKVLASARSGEGAFQVMHRLHGSLMVPGIGRQVVGWIGMAMLVSSLTGLWLWWPVVGSVRRGFRWKRHRNFDTNLHHQMGFWIALPLFALSLTGVWISFPQWFAGVERASAQRGPQGGPGRFAPPLAMPAAAIPAVVAKAETDAGGRATEIAWPTAMDKTWTVGIEAAQGRPVQVKVSAEDLATRVEASAADRPETIARLMRRIHDGDDMPVVWQIIIFLGGIIPAVLAVTGVIMWWRARGWKQGLAARRADLARR